MRIEEEFKQMCYEDESAEKFEPEKDCGTIRCPYTCDQCPVYDLEN